MAVVWLGGLFKETSLCCALLILLGEHWPLKKRAAGFAATVVATFAANKLLMTLYDVKAPVLAMNDAPHAFDIIRNTRLLYNFDILFSLDPRHVLFANAGSLLIIMLIPWRNRRDVAFKVIIVAFIISQFFCGIIREFRIWYELLPLGWMMISDTLLKEPPMVPEAPATDPPGRSRLAGQLLADDKRIAGGGFGTADPGKIHSNPTGGKQSIQSVRRSKIGFPGARRLCGSAIQPRSGPSKWRRIQTAQY
jgi:hypothetical protein